MQSSADRLVLLGRVSGAHGVRGEVVIQSFTEVPEAISTYGPLHDKSGDRQFRLSKVRFSGKRLIAVIDGVKDRNAAEALAGVELFVSRERLPQPEADEYYHADLVGLVALDGAGARIGDVVAVHNFGAGDLLEVRLAGSQRTEMFPFTKAAVPVVDIAGGRVIITLESSDDEDAAHGADIDD